MVFLSFPGSHKVDCYVLGELNSVNIFSALGIVTIGEEKKVCTTSESFIKMCDSNEVSKLMIFCQIHEIHYNRSNWCVFFLLTLCVLILARVIKWCGKWKIL